jgi:hypothetical protein
VTNIHVAEFRRVVVASCSQPHPELDELLEWASEIASDWGASLGVTPSNETTVLKIKTITGKAPVQVCHDVTGVHCYLKVYGSLLRKISPAAVAAVEHHRGHPLEHSAEIRDPSRELLLALRDSYTANRGSQVLIEIADAVPRRAYRVDPASLDERTREHHALVNTLAEAAANRGFGARLPHADEPDFDVAWNDGLGLVIAEVKTLLPANERRQLRLGLGQLLDYRYQLRSRGVAVRCVLAVECDPHDPTWRDLMADLEIALAAAPLFEAAFAH